MISTKSGWSNWKSAEHDLNRFLRPSGPTCFTKKRFDDYQDAAEISNQYNQRVALQFGIFESYWCRTHHAWHNGHRGARQAIRRLTKQQ